MTLIAGFRPYGVPILMGDFLLTSQGRQSGLRRKLRRLRLNCAVGWTGNMLAAERVLHYLNVELPEEPTREQVEQCLTRYDASPLASLFVRLVGWVVDDQASCFQWDSRYTGQCFYYEPIYEGSGADTIEKLLGPNNITDADQPDRVSVDQAVIYALQIATRLLGDEAFAQRNRTLGFGHAYEVLYLRDNRFEYADDVLYCVVTVGVNESGVFSQPTVTGHIYKYRAFDKFSLVDTWDPKVRAGVNRSIYFMTSVGDPKARDAALAFETGFWRERKADRHFFAESQYYCLFIQFVAADWVSPPVMFVQAPGETERDTWWVKGATNNVWVRLPDEWLSRMYRTMREHDRGGRISPAS